ncbi:hypothetical protein Pint_19402 [Pistacia integerrima]|uniref:Uncharacterized protein n=1 Tax=Pistacia integerrima TaxID=434235 RepID=A0ACC0YZW3_9ROSI|nr:hypothetical protein Pint_19402 [Pistacia integerrima]
MLQTPKEFLCPISGSLMADPVIVSSGHTFERACVHACKTLGFTPALVDGTAPDFSTVIPNLALKSTIPQLEENEEKDLIRGLKENPSLNFSQAVTDLTRRPGKILRYFIRGFRANHRHRANNSASTTRNSAELLLFSLLVRTGNLNPSPTTQFRRRESFRPLIEVLKGGSLEAQEHACGAIFSLSLDDNNKTAIGVLGALPPLLHLLRSESERTRHDSALALYHLSLVRSNRTKLVKLGSVNVLLGMVKSGQMVGRVLIILGNLAACPDGRVALLDSGGVECMLGYGAGEGGGHGGDAADGGERRQPASEGEGEEDIGDDERERGRRRRRRIWIGRELLESGLTSRTRFGPSTGRSESIVNSSEF